MDVLLELHVSNSFNITYTVYLNPLRIQSDKKGKRSSGPWAVEMPTCMLWISLFFQTTWHVIYGMMRFTSYNCSKIINIQQNGRDSSCNHPLTAIVPRERSILAYLQEISHLGVYEQTHVTWVWNQKNLRWKPNIISPNTVQKDYPLAKVSTCASSSWIFRDVSSLFLFSHLPKIKALKPLAPHS